MPPSGQLPPEPDHHLESVVMLSWGIAAAALTAVAAVGLAAGLPVLDDVDGVPGWVSPLLITIVVVLGIVSIVVAPAIRYRVWRYAVREDEIDLRHGWLVVTRTLVPMARVQHVETQRSFLGEILGIAVLNVHTAAGAVEIPGLAGETADRLRTQIAERAQVPDDV